MKINLATKTGISFSFAASLFAAQANADLITYNVSNAQWQGKCQSFGQGLATGQFNPGGSKCGDRYDVGDDNFFEVDVQDDPKDTTGRLFGTAVNRDGLIASYDIELSGFLERSEEYKQFNGAEYDVLTDTNDVDFFESMTGIITITDPTSGIATEFEIIGYTGGLFQYGLGANAKDAELFGASSWFDVMNVDTHEIFKWDFNLVLTLGGDGRPPNVVPEPSVLAMLGIGAGAAFSAVAKRRRRAGAKSR